MGGNTRSNIGYTLDFYFDLHAVFYIMRFKKTLQREGGGGHEHPTALGLCVFWVFEGDGKDNLTRKRRKGWKVKEVYNRNLFIIEFPLNFFWNGRMSDMLNIHVTYSETKKLTSCQKGIRFLEFRD